MSNIDASRVPRSMIIIFLRKPLGIMNLQYLCRNY